jgi:hypothetical protein
VIGYRLLPLAEEEMTEAALFYERRNRGLLGGIACAWLWRFAEMSPSATFEGDRFAYDEHRFMTLGFLAGMVVSIVHTKTPSRIHVISFRKATRNEEKLLFKNLQV